jgi:hypothetical protein
MAEPMKKCETGCREVALCFLFACEGGGVSGRKGSVRLDDVEISTKRDRGAVGTKGGEGLDVV